MQPRPSGGIPALQVLRNRDFRIIWSYNSALEMSRRLEMLTLSLFVLQETNSPFQLGLPWVFFNAPRPVLAPLFGALADRFSRKHLLMVSQSLNAAAALIVVLLFFSDLMQPWHAYIAAFIGGISRSIEDPSKRTATFDIVGSRRLVNAMSLDTLGVTVGRIAGFLIAGGAISLLDFKGAYSFALGAHLLTLALVIQLQIPRYAGASTQESVLNSLKQGAQFVAHRPMVKAVFFATIILSVFLFPFNQFIPAIGRDHLGVGPALIGLLAAGESFGTIGATAFLSTIRNVRYHGRWFIAGTLTLIVGAMIFTWSPWFATSFAILLLMGLGNGCFMAMHTPIIMLSAPRELRGRLIGLMNICTGAGMPLGTLAIGAVASTFDTQWGVFQSASTALLLYVPLMLFTPLLRQRLEEAQPSTD